MGKENEMEVVLNMYQAFALAAIFYYVGVFLKKKIIALQRFCVPEPAIGGLVFAILTLILHQTGIMTVSMDTTLSTVCMWIFFSSIGFAARLNLLAKSGKKLVILLIACIGLMLVQNGVGIGIMKAFGQNPLLGLCVGSMSMIGGHGTAATFGDIVGAAGAPASMTVALAAATFGVVSGGMTGGPAAEMRIMKHGLKSVIKNDVENIGEKTVKAEFLPTINNKKFMLAAALMVICVAPGQLISNAITAAGFTFPVPVTITVVACLVRTVCDARKIELPEVEIDSIGYVMLGLFLTLSMMNIQLWQLIDLALPMIIALILELVVTVCFSYFIVFRLMGGDYEAAVISAGTIGFGMGATPNALANMQAVRERFGPAPQAFIIIPLLGTLFIDIFNSLVITFLMNVLA